MYIKFIHCHKMLDLMSFGILYKEMRSRFADLWSKTIICHRLERGKHGYFSSMHKK